MCFLCVMIMVFYTVGMKRTEYIWISCLQISLFLLLQRLFTKLTLLFLFRRTVNPTCAAFLISCGHSKGYCTQAQTLSENGD